MTLCAPIMQAVSGFNGLTPDDRAGILPTKDHKSFFNQVKAAFTNPTGPKKKMDQVAEGIEKTLPDKINAHAFAPPGMEMS